MQKPTVPSPESIPLTRHSGHKHIQLANGQWSLHCTEVSETYHPVIGPESEAEQLYAGQIYIERMNSLSEFVVWDIGLGGAANALSVINAASNYTGKLQLYSFEHNLEPLILAIENSDKLPYIQPFIQIIYKLLSHRLLEFQYGSAHIKWQIIYGDFPEWLNRYTTHSTEDAFAVPPPAAIFYDAFSPKKNPDMYTLDIFKKLRTALDENIPCLLASYSRATLLRTTLLLAGFYVGRGAATGEKEETTVASNSLALLKNPLPISWLERVRRSTSAEPLYSPIYLQKPLSQKHWEKLLLAPQFQANISLFDKENKERKY